LVSQSLRDFQNFSSDHFSDISAWWDLRCTGSEHFHEGNFDLRNRGCISESIVGGLLVISVKWAFSASSVENFSGDTLKTSTENFDLSASAFQDSVNSSISVFFEISESDHMRLNIFFLDLSSDFLGFYSIALSRSAS